MKTKAPPKSFLFCAALLALFMAFPSLAGTFTSDFSDPGQLGLTLNGGLRPAPNDALPYPVIEDGVLKLTYAENGETGSIVLDELDPGQTLGGFTATFKVKICCGSSTSADGMSFYFGNDIDSSARFGEEGPDNGQGITVSLDTFDNTGPGNNPLDGIGEAPAIDVKVGGVQVAHTLVGGFDLIVDQFTPVVITLKPNGALTVSFKGRDIYKDLYLPGYSPIAGGRFAIGGRTGGLNENNWVDDLSITTTVAGAPVGPTIAAGNQPQSQTVNERSAVTFSVAPDGTPPFSFEWFKDGQSISGATDRTYTIDSVPGSLSGSKYKVKVTNGFGFVDSDEALLTVNLDTTKPTIVKANGSASLNTVTVVFSEPVTAATAGTIGNYGLSGGLTFAGPPTVLNSTTVRLDTSAQTPGTVYTLTVNNIQDTASTANTIIPNSMANFTAWVLSRGLLKFEVWNNLSTSDNNIDNTLLADPRYPDFPDVVTYTTAFDSRPVYPNDSHEGYGGAMSGWITPTVDGDYRFFLNSDDSSRLFISPDDQAANLAQVAEETACCNAFSEPGNPRTSEPIALTAGNSYAVRVIWKEGTGGDYCRVAWRLETDTTPAGSLTPIPGAFLSVLADPSLASIVFNTQPASVSTTENKTTTFTVAVTASPTPVFYQWQRSEPGNATFVDIAGANGTSHTTAALKRALDDGAKYRCVVTVPGLSSPSAVASLAVSIDTTPPALVSAAAGANVRSVTLAFSEALDPVSAAIAGNYTIPGLSVSSARLLNPSTVQLVTSLQAPNTTYTVTVKPDVKDTAIPANGMDPSANSKSFTALILVEGVMAFEVYGGIPTTAVANLTSNPKYPNSPDRVQLIASFNSPAGDMENYGAKMTGFITVPEAGDYDLFLRSDDASQLFISTDDDPGNLSATPIAEEPGCCAAFQEPGARQTTAAPLSLEAGKRYYIVALYKEAGGGDYCQVAIRKTDDTTPASSLAPIPSSMLSVAVTKSVYDSFTLPESLRSPLGSGDANQPGFKARIWQVDAPGANQLATVITRAEQELAGIIGPNVADLSLAQNGVFNLDALLNWSGDGDPNSPTPVGNFSVTSTPAYPDDPIPGIPGTGTASHNADSIAGEVVTYVEFPAAGLYILGVNSDDGFKTTATDTPPVNNESVIITPAGGTPMAFHAVSGGGDSGGAFAPTVAPISGKLVKGDPLQACSALVNVGEVTGNVVLVYRGVCAFSAVKGNNARNAGATAMIVVNSRDPSSSDGKFPIVMAGDFADIPAVMVTKPDGDIIKALLEAGNVTVTITPDSTPALGRFNGGRGASDSTFPVNVAAPGIYPLRTVWYEGGGGANLELFRVLPDGTKIPLNDSSSPDSLRTFRSRTLTQPITMAVGREGDNVNLSWVGGTGPFLVQKKAKLNDPNWINVVTTSARSVSIPAVGGSGFFRVVDNAVVQVSLFKAVMTGAAEKPNAVATPAKGLGMFSLQGNTLTYAISYQGLTANATAGHIHGPADANTAAGVLQGFSPGPSGTAGLLTGTVVLTPAATAALQAGNTYANFHTSAFPGGEIRGQIVP